DGHRSRHGEDPQDRASFFGNDAIDIALRGKLQRADDDAVALDWYRDGDDIFALLAAPAHRLDSGAIQSVHDFVIADAAATGLLAVDRQGGVEKKRTRPVADPVPDAGLRFLQRR